MSVDRNAAFARTKRRVVALFGIMVVGYAGSLLLLGLATGFDHRLERWLFAAAFAALATGFTASVVMRIVILILDPNGRMGWWTEQSKAVRVSATFLLAFRVVMAAVLWWIASRPLIGA